MAEWNFACPAWLRRMERGEVLVPDLPLNEELAAQAVDAFNNLRLPDVIGTPRLADAGADWFRAVVAAIFGSIDEAGRRRAHEVFLLVPKKQSKTTNSAAVMLTAMLLNQVPRADLLLIGPTQKISERAFDQAVGMIKADPEGYLQKRFHIQQHTKTIEDLTGDEEGRGKGSKLRVRTLSPDVLTGVIPIVVLIDEVHLLGAVHYAERVLRQIRGGLAAKPNQRILIFITTQSDIPPAGVFKAELKRAREIRDGKQSGPHIGMLPVLYEFPEAMQRAKDRPWLDPKTWPMVMPNLNLSIGLQELIDDFENERTKGEEAIRLWASQHLNIQIGMALHDDRWEGADLWEAAGDRTLTLETLLARSEVAVVAIDGGGRDDLLGLCVMGREKGTQRWLAWFKAFCRERVLTRRPEIAPALLDFEKAGDLWIYREALFHEDDDRADPEIEEAPEINPRLLGGDAPLADGSEGDEGAPPVKPLDAASRRFLAPVLDIVKVVIDSGLLPEKGAIGLDPAGVAAIVDALAAPPLGLTVGPGKQVVGVAQTAANLNSAIVGWPLKLEDGSFAHNGSEMMAWCVNNAKAELRGNATIITKQTSGKAKIDPFVAGCAAVKLMEWNPEAAASSGSYLDEEDLILV